MKSDGQFILTVNAGSSSLRFALFRTGEEPARAFAGKFERLGGAGARLSVENPQTQERDRRDLDAGDHACWVPLLVEWLDETIPTDSVRAIGHRIVHGGPRYFEPALVDAPLLSELKRLVPIDPEHLPAEIGVIEELARRYPGLPQIACFDTEFHRGLPRVARLLPIPRRYAAQGVRRYGFHGLSYAYLMAQLERLAGSAARGRVLLAHLGNGASLAAVRDGQCLDTTMAFTPAAGLVMSTRCGDLDPGLAGYLARTEGLDAAAFNHLVNAESGLLGVSETSGDVRELLKREPADERAADALALFCYQARKWIGAFAAVLGGLDTLVFSGGIGENSAVIRARICAGLGYLGLDLDAELNEANAPILTRDGSRVTVRVIRTDEEWCIARTVCARLGDATTANQKTAYA